MTRSGKNARTAVDRLEAHGRLRRAKAFHLVAKESLTLLEKAGLDRAPVHSNALLAAIAYTDAVAITANGSLNQKDHSTAPAVLRDCVGRDLPDGRLNDLKGMLSVKDEVQYGVRTLAQDGAERTLEQLDRFSAWALSWLEARGVL